MLKSVSQRVVTYPATIILYLLKLNNYHLRSSLKRVWSDFCLALSITKPIKRGCCNQFCSHVNDDFLPLQGGYSPQQGNNVGSEFYGGSMGYSTGFGQMNLSAVSWRGSQAQL
jgi:hypothetical protein